MTRNFPHIFALIFCFLCSLSSPAQQKVLDSLLKAGTLEIYDNPDHAIEIGKKVYGENNDNLKTKLNSLMLISDAYSSKRDYRKSLEYVIRAKNLSAKSDNVLVQIKILTKIAIQYHQQRIYDKAIQYLDESSKLAKAYPSRDSVHSQIGNNYAIRGFIYKEQLNCDIAIEYFRQAIAEYGFIATQMINANISIMKYNIGNCYIRSGDNEAAKKSFIESIAHAKKIDAKSLLAFAQKGLAEVYTLEGRYPEAISVLKEALNVSGGVGDLVLNLGIYKGLSENYLAVNEWDNYRKFHQKYLETGLTIKESERKSVSDSLNDLSKTQRIKVGNAKKNYIFLILIFGFLSLLTAVGILLHIKKAKKKAQLLRQKIQELQKN